MLYDRPLVAGPHTSTLSRTSHRLFGTVPVRALNERSKRDVTAKLPKDGGIVPVSMFSARVSCRTLIVAVPEAILPNEAGIAPVRRFPSNPSMPTSFVQLPSEAGMLPDRLLSVSMNLSNKSKSTPILNGIVPDRL